MQRVDVRLASDDASWCEEITQQLAPVADIVVTATAPLAGLGASASPAVVVVDARGSLEAALVAIGRQTRAEQGSAYVLMLGPDEDPAAVYPRAALAGVRVVLRVGCELPELAEGIYKAADCVGDRQTEQEAGTAAAADRMVAVFGTKGGCGKTTLAVNLAVALASRGLRTALLDLHFDWGTVAVHLRGAPPRPLSELLAESKRLDADLLQSFMVRHPTGVAVLPAPPKPEMAEFVTAEHVTAIVAAARDGFDAVVYDLPPGFPATVFPALEAADHVLLVTTPDVPALRNARAALGVVEMLNLTHAKTHLVVNRAGSQFGIRRADVEATLGLPVWAAIPSDDAVVVRGANEGLAVVASHQASRYARAVTALARQLVPEAHGAARRAARVELHPASAR